MSATIDGEQLDAPEAVSIAADPGARNIATAVRRLSRAEVLLGVLALISFATVFLRLFERWRVTPHAVSHRIAILGHTLGYPAANLAAIVVLALALLGAAVLAIALAAATRELRGTRRLRHRLAAEDPLEVEEVFVIDDARPQAFCLGLLTPRVYVSTGALELLDEEALEAVLIHERHHARRRDPLRLAVSRVLARALFFLPGLAELRDCRETLTEISADETVIEAAPTNRSALARAMLSFMEAPTADESVGIDPARVDHLIGNPPSWRFPISMFLVAAFLLALLAAVAVLVGQEAAGSASLAPPFLSAQPCVVVLALIPVGVGLIVVALARLRRG